MGDSCRPGHAWTDGRIVAPDHDFRSCATGKLVPYGVYDVHEGLMTLTTSDDTPELACAAVRRRWYRLGKYNAIEHRVFCHVERSLRGVILNSIDTAAWFISRTSTATGLSLVVEQARRGCQKAQWAIAHFLETFLIFYDDQRPELNYYTTPHKY